MASKDADALDAFYTRYNRLAFSLIFRIVGNRADAEDVLTDVFWQVWQQSAAIRRRARQTCGLASHDRADSGNRLSSLNQPCAVEDR